MNDQADKLRQIIENLRSRQVAPQPDNTEMRRKRSAKVITVTSGKGGVGKTNIAINIAIALNGMGKRVVIIDADFGLANIDVLMGLSPQYTLADVINNRKNILEVLASGPRNIKFVSGGSGVEELIKLDNIQLKKFIDNISLLDRIFDVILIDTGAGLSDNVMSFVMAADDVILVTTPEPTSITDAYALIKMISNRDCKKSIKVIVNRAENINEANDILDKLSMVAEKFLNFKLISLGFILFDECVVKAVKMQQPFLLSYPKSQAARHVYSISEQLIESSNLDNTNDNSGIKGFMNRLANLLRL